MAAKKKKKTATKKAAAPKKAAPKKAAPKKAAPASKPKPRADFGQPIDEFIAKRAPPQRALIEKLRSLVEAAAPDATSSLKWGMPFYMVGTGMYCAIGAHKAHVNLILSGPPDAFADPKGLLTGDGKTGRHLKLMSVNEVPVDAVRGWLKAAAALARAHH